MVFATAEDVMTFVNDETDDFGMLPDLAPVTAEDTLDWLPASSDGDDMDHLSNVDPDVFTRDPFSVNDWAEPAFDHEGFDDVMPLSSGTSSPSNDPFSAYSSDAGAYHCPVD
jgi:hypothetical protein